MNELAEWDRSRADLARWGQRVENDVVDMPCGIMDQSACLRCEEGALLFMDTRSGAVEQVPWPADQDAVLLVSNTNAPHVLADGQYAERRRLCEEATRLLEVPSLRDATDADLAERADSLSADQLACARHVVGENARVLAVRDLLEQGRLTEIGPVLTASHASLRDDFRVTVPQLDLSVDTALAHGAWGARMTGGGFGGCTIALVRAADADSIAAAIDAAFEEAAFRLPEHFLATPSAGAHRNRVGGDA
jgi:galactokinase